MTTLPSVNTTLGDGFCEPAIEAQPSGHSLPLPEGVIVLPGQTEPVEPKSMRAPCSTAATVALPCPAAGGSYAELLAERATPGFHDQFGQTVSASDSHSMPVYTVVNALSIVSADKRMKILLEGNSDGAQWASDDMSEAVLSRLHANRYRIQISDMVSDRAASAVFDTEDRYALKLLCEEKLALALGCSFDEGRKCLEAQPGAKMELEPDRKFWKTDDVI